MSDLKEAVERIFSVGYLQKDPTLVFAMDSDMWISVRFLMNLEEFKIIRAEFDDIVRAALDLGFEFNPALGLIRKKFSVPRTQVLVGGFSDAVELKVALDKFDYISIQDVEGKNELLLNCFCEEHAVEMALFLRGIGKSAIIESVDTYLMLVSNAVKFVKEFEVIPFFFEPLKRVYSFAEVKNAYLQNVFVKPKELEKCKFGIIAGSAGKIEVFNE